MRQHPRGLDLQSRIERLASEIGDFTTVRAALDRELRAAVRYDVAALSTMDPATMCWTSCFVAGVDHDDGWERVIYDHEFGAEEPNSFAQLARAERPVARLFEATGGDLRTVGRFEDLLEPLGAVDEMRAVLRSHGACWGTITCYRLHPNPTFSSDDEQTLVAAAPAIADLFRLAMLRAAADAPGALDMAPGLLTVDANGEVLQRTTEAEAWLSVLDDRDRVPSVVRSLAAAASRGSGLTRAALPSRQGSWITLHASGLIGGGTDDAQVAVIIEATRPIVLSELVTEAYGLTSREREVTSLIAMGLTNKEISRRLGISPFTTEDHVKAVFAKTLVANRGSLVALLQHQHYQPRNDARNHPGPYGWYLDGSVTIAG